MNWCCWKPVGWIGKGAEYKASDRAVNFVHAGMHIEACIDGCTASRNFTYHDGSSSTAVADSSFSNEYGVLRATRVGGGKAWLRPVTARSAPANRPRV